MIRPITDADYPMLQKWWDGHNSLPVPQHILPRGWVLASGPVDVVAAFLMLDVGGKFAVIEFLTTNPSVAFSRTLVQDVRTLIAHIEQRAMEQGCTWMMSFVAPGTGEERLMVRLGYQTSEGPAHRIYAKALMKKEEK
jgi:hypothetical protein